MNLNEQNDKIFDPRKSAIILRASIIFKLFYFKALFRALKFGKSSFHFLKLFPFLAVPNGESNETLQDPGRAIGDGDNGIEIPEPSAEKGGSVIYRFI